MSKAVRGEPTVTDDFYSLRRGMLDLASDIIAKGGPQGNFDRVFVEAAQEIGISDIEIKAAASSKRSILKGFEELIPIDDF